MYQKGFTIVELLVVIVVIAILAAIAIVSYNGITSRAKAAQGAAIARQVADTIELWSTLQGSYPTYGQLVTNSLSPTYANGQYTAGGAPGPKEAKLNPSLVFFEDDYPRTEGSLGIITCRIAPGGGAVVYRDSTVSIGASDVRWGGAPPITYGSKPFC